VIAPEKLGNRKESEALSEILLQNDVAFTFDPNKEQISWIGDTLSINSAATGKPVQQYIATSTNGVLLMQNAKDGKVTGAFTEAGIRACEIKDIDAKIRDINRDTVPPKMILFYEFREVLYASDGGVTILVIDPAIIENDLSVAGLRLEAFLIGITPWDAHFLSLAAVPRPSIFATPYDSSSTSDAATRVVLIDNFNEITSKDPLLVATLKGDVQIESCYRTFTIRSATEGVFDLTPAGCPFGIRLFKGDGARAEFYSFIPDCPITLVPSSGTR
jgi:hypothetical protein